MQFFLDLGLKIIKLSCDTDLASDGSLLESFNTLSKGLRNLKDVPLGISSVQPLDSGLFSFKLSMRYYPVNKSFLGQISDKIIQI